jgi:hypothetical protein
MFDYRVTINTFTATDPFTEMSEIRLTQPYQVFADKVGVLLTSELLERAPTRIDAFRRKWCVSRESRDIVVTTAQVLMTGTGHYHRTAFADGEEMGYSIQCCVLSQFAHALTYLAQYVQAHCCWTCASKGHLSLAQAYMYQSSPGDNFDGGRLRPICRDCADKITVLQPNARQHLLDPDVAKHALHLKNSEDRGDWSVVALPDMPSASWPLSKVLL